MTDSPRLTLKQAIDDCMQWMISSGYSLRHSFAINTLKRIKERGDCPQHALPVLATYMGHHIYQYTAKYLKFIDAEQRQSLFDFARLKMENI